MSIPEEVIWIALGSLTGIVYWALVNRVARLEESVRDKFVWTRHEVRSLHDADKQVLILVVDLFPEENASETAKRMKRSLLNKSRATKFDEETEVTP